MPRSVMQHLWAGNIIIPALEKWWKLEILHPRAFSRDAVIGHHTDIRIIISSLFSSVFCNSDDLIVIIKQADMKLRSMVVLILFIFMTSSDSISDCMLTQDLPLLCEYWHYTFWNYSNIIVFPLASFPTKLPVDLSTLFPIKFMIPFSLIVAYIYICVCACKYVCLCEYACVYNLNTWI